MLKISSSTDFSRFLNVLIVEQLPTKKHSLTQILLQPKKAKRQAAIYFDGTSLEGKKLSIVNIDKSQKGRVKIKIKALDVMA